MFKLKLGNIYVSSHWKSRDVAVRWGRWSWLGRRHLAKDPNFWSTGMKQCGQTAHNIKLYNKDRSRSGLYIAHFHIFLGFFLFTFFIPTIFTIIFGTLFRASTLQTVWWMLNKNCMLVLCLHMVLNTHVDPRYPQAGPLQPLRRDHAWQPHEAREDAVQRVQTRWWGSAVPRCAFWSPNLWWELSTIFWGRL